MEPYEASCDGARRLGRRSRVGRVRVRSDAAIKDPANPETFSKPIDLNRNGLTDYSHDVDVDANGIAWVSGRGGLRGFATRGRWRDPVTDRVRPAAPWRPVLVAGGGLPGGDAGVAQPQTDFIHNAARPLNGKVQATGVPDGNIALMTEEDFTSPPCDQAGRIVAADITSSLGGEDSTNSTPEKPFRMTALDSFHPARNAAGTTSTNTSCSAHYYEVSGSTLGAAWYNQGLRVIDASDARDLRQVGYYYVNGTGPENPSSLSWDTAWRGDLVFLFDMDRGIEILRLKGGPRASARLATVREPRTRVDRLVKAPVASSGLTRGSLVCPLFAAQ